MYVTKLACSPNKGCDIMSCIMETLLAPKLSWSPKEATIEQCIVNKMTGEKELWSEPNTRSKSNSKECTES